MKPKSQPPPAVRKLAKKLWAIGYMAKRRFIYEKEKPLQWHDVTPGNQFGWYAVARHLLKPSKTKPSQNTKSNYASR